MGRIVLSIVSIATDNLGQGLSEYGLIIGMVSILAAVGLELLGFNIGDFLAKTSEFVISFIGGL